MVNGASDAVASAKFAEPAPDGAAVSVRGLSVHYGTKTALKSVDFEAPANQVTALIGPSGCGKSTFLRSLNRMNDRIPGARVEGSIRLGDMSPCDKHCDLMVLRRRVGMVFQMPNPFPMSIFENVAMATKLHFGLRGRALEDAAIEALMKASLWNEVKDDWKKKSGLELSGGQQQRLCIARMLAVRPDFILMDEPCSALDPISTSHVEDLTRELARSHTVLVVTHNLQQAKRISQRTAFFMFGELIEIGPSERVLGDPVYAATRDYVSGVFG